MELSNIFTPFPLKLFKLFCDLSRKHKPNDFTGKLLTKECLTETVPKI